jgi:hypothetical protein
MNFYDESALQELYYSKIESDEVLKNSSNEILNLCVLMFCIQYPYKRNNSCSLLTSSISPRKGSLPFYVTRIYYNGCIVTQYYKPGDISNYSKEYFEFKYKGTNYLLKWDINWRSSGDWVQVYFKMKRVLNHEP